MTVPAFLSVCGIVAVRKRQDLHDRAVAARIARLDQKQYDRVLHALLWGS